MKRPFINATFAATYIVIIVSVVNITNSILKDLNETIIIPMTMLSLFVLSAAIMGYLFLSEPVSLLIEKRKQDAIIFFVKTVAFFACYVAFFAIAVLLTNMIT